VQLCPSLQLVPVGLLPPSTQVWAPVMQEVTPSLQGFGLVVQATFAVQATHMAEAVQTMLVPQFEPVGLCVLLMQVWVPVVQLVMPV
jgi:hypothetical protein